MQHHRLEWVLYQLRFICGVLAGKCVLVSCGRTASRKHRPNFSNSCLQLSLRTSVYIAAMHFPYAAACDAHVVVECRARRFRGLVGLCADCMVVEQVRNCNTVQYYYLNRIVQILNLGSWLEPPLTLSLLSPRVH